MSTAEQGKTAAAAATTQEAASHEEAGKNILPQILSTTRPRDQEEAQRNQTYIEQFVRQAVKPGMIVSRDVETTIKAWIKQIDQKLSAQLNEILHHPDLQKLESTWRGLHYLVQQTETGEFLKIRVLNVTKRELLKDLEKASEFDQSQMFKKIYTEEYDQLGGTPYGMLIGDYQFDRMPEDMFLLEKISNVAAASHAPFVAAVSPGMFNMERFTEMPNPRDLAKIFEGVEYVKWRSFRESEDSRYVALTMPRVLARLPYGENFKKVDEFNYEEDVDGTNHDKYLWMSAAWAYGARITDAYAKYGWMLRSRGVEGGGKVEGLPVHTFPTDDGEVAMKCPTEIAISDRREFELSNLGFLPLLHCKNTDFAAFLGAQSCQRPKTYFQADANANAELSTKFNLMLVVSRFAHYLKVMARNKIGSIMEAQKCQLWLNDWINNYVHPSPDTAGEEALAAKPLREARIQVVPNPARPGWYEATAWLRPHFQMETLTTSFRLVAQVPEKKG